METKQLKVFRAIVEAGSFTAAGDALGMSQPAISQQMRSLETLVGAPLVTRAGRGTRLTTAGEALLPYARLVLDKLAEASRRVADHAVGRSGLVRIGTPEPACNYLLPSVIAELHARLPTIALRVTSGHTLLTLDRLDAGDLDVALLPLPIQAQRLRVVDVGGADLVALVPPQHPWSGRRFVEPSAFEGQSLILYDRASQITERTLSMLLEAAVFPRIAVEIDHLEAMKDLVRHGVGVAVMPRWAAAREVAAGALVALRIGEAGLVRTWGLVYRDTGPQTGAFRAVVQAMAGLLAERLRAA